MIEVQGRSLYQRRKQTLEASAKETETNIFAENMQVALSQDPAPVNMLLPTVSMVWSVLRASRFMRYFTWKDASAKHSEMNLEANCQASEASNVIGCNLERSTTMN